MNLQGILFLLEIKVKQTNVIFIFTVDSCLGQIVQPVALDLFFVRKNFARSPLNTRFDLEEIAT